MHDERHIWEEFKRGEKYALSYIYSQYVNQLFSYGKKFTSDDELVKDTIQDLYFDIIRTRESLGSTNNIYFYLLKSFRRKLFRSIETSKKFIRLNEAFATFPANIIYSAEEALLQKERISERDELIKQGLARLSPKQREILYYRFTCEFEYEQICEIMAIRYDSARKIVFRAIKMLREYIFEKSESLAKR